MNFVLYEDYHMITSNGDFMLTFDEYLREPYISSNGYYYQPMYFGSGHLSFKRLDIMVAETFLILPEDLIGERLTVKHIDGDLSNNAASNLKIVRDEELWRKLVYRGEVYDDYEVSTYGRIRNINNGIICSNAAKDGYRYVTLRLKDHSRKRVGLHIIICETFSPKIDNMYELCVNHIDGIHDNNHIDNLEFVSKSQNNFHASISHLHSNNATIEMKYRIQKLLVKYDGSIVKVVNEINDKNITETVVSRQKQLMVQNMGYTFGINHVIKLNNDDISILKKSLLEHDGNVNKVFELHEFKNDHITISNIYTVRNMLIKEGYIFTNRKLNKKITESERSELIKLLLLNDNSPSKTFKYISDIDRFKNVSVYDLKYLKRKYKSP